jgi:hypothetical protein
VQAAEDAFYADAASSFEQLGIIPAVSDALKAAGFSKPSRVQVCAAGQEPFQLSQVTCGASVSGIAHADTSQCTDTQARYSTCFIILCMSSTVCRQCTAQKHVLHAGLTQLVVSAALCKQLYAHALSVV